MDIIAQYAVIYPIICLLEPSLGVFWRYSKSPSCHLWCSCYPSIQRCCAVMFSVFLFSILPFLLFWFWEGYVWFFFFCFAWLRQRRDFRILAMPSSCWMHDTSVVHYSCILSTATFVPSRIYDSASMRIALSDSAWLVGCLNYRCLGTMCYILVGLRLWVQTSLSKYHNHLT